MAKRVDRSLRLKRLLEAGHLPEELPPPFVTRSFAKFRRAIEQQWTANKAPLQKFQSSPEPYSVPKFGHARRRVVIVNPISHFRVSKVIAENWSEIRKFLLKSKVTEFRPIFDTSGDRSIFGINWSGVTSSKIRIASRYFSQFQTDISKFYPSIYTHSFAWSYFGKEIIQQNLNANWYKKSFLNSLDIAVRHGQRNQSVGIPIGPDTSRIIAELVAVGIEQQIRNHIPDFDDRDLRYIDDFTIGLDENETDDFISSALESALSHFELDVNFDKTRVLGVKGEGESRWKQELSALRVGLRGQTQKDDIERYFGAAVAYAEKSEKDAVLKWAIKRSRSFKINNRNYTFYVETLLAASRRAPACLPALAQILVDARHAGRKLPIESVRKFLVDHIRVHAPVGHAFEVSWALFLCKGLHISLLRTEVDHVFRMRSSVCALLIMDLNARALIDGGIDDSFWRKECGSTAGLRSDMWLLAYEAVRKRWWSPPIVDYVSNDQLFAPLLSRGVFFYDEKKNFRTTRGEAKRNIEHWRLASLVLENWEVYF